MQQCLPRVSIHIKPTAIARTFHSACSVVRLQIRGPRPPRPIDPRPHTLRLDEHDVLRHHCRASELCHLSGAANPSRWRSTHHGRPKLPGRSPSPNIPIIRSANFWAQDPSIIRVADGWHIFSTNAKINGKLIHVQMAQSSDWKKWTFRKGVDAMPSLASWIDKKSPRVWAPDVNVQNDGSFIMYYTAALKAYPHIHCLGFATSKNVDGPYVDRSLEPWICPLKQGGAIDPSGFINQDGTRWVVYKVDGNAIGNGGECGNTKKPIVPTPILLQQVNARDGHTKIGGPVQILTNIPADGPYVEAPSLSFLNGKYVLFFSPQCFVTDKYNVNYALSDNLKGPYKRAGPLFVTGKLGLKGPGGLDIAVNGDHAVWHADYDRGRATYTAILKLKENKITAST